MKYHVYIVEKCEAKLLSFSSLEEAEKAILRLQEEEEAGSESWISAIFCGKIVWSEFGSKELFPSTKLSNLVQIK